MEEGDSYQTIAINGTVTDIHQCPAAAHGGRGTNGQPRYAFRVTASLSWHPVYVLAPAVQFQEWTQLLDHLVTAAKEGPVDWPAWHVEDVVHKQEGDQVDQEFQDRLLALKEMHLQAQKRQITMVATAVEVTEEDCQVLDTILALVVIFMVPAVQPLSTAPPAP
ncbi:hypothetical protein Y1Q_0002253 [Alligator mississippiensis]|uniref:Uncharacterized protein n=1 Tax=Alligator mississippiensis TaxID=8496 RepID=A0A151MGJ4_ALLMI|nr:hypothetical protein Y1Q_0002253 [Alligator mississippiensis]